MMITQDKPDIQDSPTISMRTRAPRTYIIFGAYAVFSIAMLTAAMSRAIAGLKPGDLAIVLLAGLLIVRRISRRDANFAVTPVDGGFALFILTGTVLPILAALVRQIYVTGDMFHALVGPVEYYLWYRAILEAVPVRSRLPEMMRVVLSATTIISVIGVLQIAHIPGVADFLLRYYPTLETFESQFVHRATSLVGGWETLAALAAYAIILTNQLQLAEETTPTLGKRWNRALLLMLIVNVVALVATLSVTGIIAVALGYGIAWRYNGRLARSTRLALLGAVVALVALAPFVAQRTLAQLGTKSGHGVVPQTWATRFEHWHITLSTIFVGVPHVLFGVQPSFAYPVLSFGSTESLYLLLLYRGGFLYLIAFLVFIAMVVRQLQCARRTTTGFAHHVATAILTIFIVNFGIDILDAHLFGAGEAQFLFTLLALGVGLSQHAAAADAETMMNWGAARLLRPPPLPPYIIRDIIAGMLLLSVIVTGVAVYRNHHHIAPPPVLQIFSYDPPTATMRENQQLGTTAWEIDPGASTTFIQGYAGRASALPGETVPLYISSRQPTPYAMDVYRIGWYYGLGAHLYRSVATLHSTAQGIWTPQAGLQQCATCQLDVTTHLLAAQWSVSYNLAIAPSWPSGVYLIKLTATAQHAESYIPLVIRSNYPHALILASLPVNTYAATNPWGGYDLASGDPSDGPTPAAIVRADAVSFDRPYGTSAGAGSLLDQDIYTVRWLERMGFDTAYTTNVDVDAQPTAPRSAHIFLALGHDAYWTRAMRDGITAARNDGINLAFFGAGDAFWQARFAADSDGQPRRTLICYKVSAPVAQLTRDPIYQTQPSLVTASWRDPSLNEPENALLGAMYAGISTPGSQPANWMTPSGTLDTLAHGAGLHANQRLTTVPVGFAYDAVTGNGHTPPQLVTLAQSSPARLPHIDQLAATTYYRAASGALVFDAGATWWSWGLDESTTPDAAQANLLRGNQNILNLTIAMIHAMAATK